jgi:uncharacterized protein (DUF885 family)
MLYATFATKYPGDGIAIYDDETHNSTGPLLRLDWDEVHRLGMEMQSLRDQRDVQLRRASIKLVPDTETDMDTNYGGTT